MARVFSLSWFPVLSVNLFVSVNGWNFAQFDSFYFSIFSSPLRVCHYYLICTFLFTSRMFLRYLFRHWLVDGARCILFIYVVIHSWFNLSIGVECQRFDMRGKPMSQRYYFSFWNLCRFGIRWWNEATITVKKSAARQQWNTRRRATHHHHRSSFRLSFGHLKKEQEKIPPEHIKSCCAFFVDGPFCFFMDKPNPLSSLSLLRV